MISLFKSIKTDTIEEWIPDIQEDWVLEDTEFNQAIHILSSWIKASPNERCQLLADEEMSQLIRILAYLNFKKFILFLTYISQRIPGIAGDVSLLRQDFQQSTLEDPPTIEEIHLVFQRIRLIWRLQQFKRIFGPENRQSVTQLLTQGITSS